MLSSQQEVLCALRDTDAKTVAFCGCSKNAGKTTAMNVMTAGWDRAGLMSIGIDGEDSDFWLGVPKPRIAARPGTVFATARRALGAATVDPEILEDTGISTPLGEIVIARARAGGRVLLAGVRHKADVLVIRDCMRALGVERIAVDGAYQRLMSADPAVSDGVILATGAILGTSAAEVADRTMDFLTRLTLPPIDDDYLNGLVDESSRLGLAVAADRNGAVLKALDPGPAGAVGLLETAGAVITHIAVPGSIPEGFTGAVERAFSRLARHPAGDGLAILVQDPTRVFLRTQEFRWLARRGHSIAVARPIRLLAVAVNPVSIIGGSIPSAELVEAIGRLIKGIPVLDFVAAAG